MSVEMTNEPVQSHMGSSIRYAAKILCTYLVDMTVILVKSETCAPILDELLGARVFSADQFLGTVSAESSLPLSAYSAINDFILHIGYLIGFLLALLRLVVILLRLQEVGWL